MQVIPLAIADSFLFIPEMLRDDRGSFHEAFRSEVLAELGHGFRPAQSNYSVSRRNVVRGIHGTLMPPGQSKLVGCPRGAVRDFVVDLRPGSPTFGQHESTILDDESGRSVFIAEGLGHAFVALTDDACVSYLCSTSFVPGTQLDIHPFDPDLALPWEIQDVVVSGKDARAPTLKQALARGLLPSYPECVRHYRRGMPGDHAFSSDSLPRSASITEATAKTS